MRSPTRFVAAGITRINGSLIGDGTRYDDEFFVEGWGDDVKIVEAGPYDALLVNDARTVGRTAVQPDPNEAGARELVRLLQARGIRVGGTWATGVADPAAAEIASVQSAPLTAVVAEMLTNSDDNTAEMMLKEIGFATAGQGTRAAGLNAVDQRLRTWGVPMDGVRPIDGSGLSIENRTTCAAMLAVLQHVAGGPVAAGLPVAGRTGTLVGEFVGNPVEGRLIGQDRLARESSGQRRPACGQGIGRVSPGGERRFRRVRAHPERAGHRGRELPTALARLGGTPRDLPGRRRPGRARPQLSDFG